MYLVLVIFFFPETRSVTFSNNWLQIGFLIKSVSRRLTIEEVSVIFDTGRLGDSAAATAQLRNHDTKSGALDDEASYGNKDTAEHTEANKSSA